MGSPSGYRGRLSFKSCGLALPLGGWSWNIKLGVLSTKTLPLSTGWEIVCAVLFVACFDLRLDIYSTITRGTD
jgi:hypothetical protein